jgi:general secretion pathway protein G
MKKRLKGFTLVELVITIGVITILVGVATPQIIGYVNRSKIARVQMELTSLRSALQSYNADWGEYPSSLKALRGTESSERNIATSVSQTGLQGPIDYIEKDLPVDIFWTSETNKNYKYAVNSDKTSFILWSNGPNKKGLALTTPTYSDGEWVLTGSGTGGKDSDDIIVLP